MNVLDQLVASASDRARSDTGRIALAHVVDSESEADGQVLFEGHGSQERVLGAAGAAPLFEHQAIIRSVRVSPVGEFVEKVGRSSVACAPRSHEGARKDKDAARLAGHCQRVVGKNRPRVHT